MHKISPETSFVGQNHLFLKSTGSTNEAAKAMLKTADMPSGFLIVSDYQTEGRGRMNNKWEGEAGKNIYASFILKPYKLNIKDLSYLNFACTLSVFDLIKQELPDTDVAIKWPNDILLNQKKVAGVLIENQISGNKLSSSVFGVGINVNQSRFSNGLEHACSMMQQNGQDLRMEVVLEHLCQHLETRLTQLDHMQYPLLHGQFNHSLFQRNNPIRYWIGDKHFEAVLEGVNTDGELEVRTPKGIEHFAMGAIKLDVYGTGY